MNDKNGRNEEMEKEKIRKRNNKRRRRREEYVKLERKGMREGVTEEREVE